MKENTEMCRKINYFNIYVGKKHKCIEKLAFLNIYEEKWVERVAQFIMDELKGINVLIKYSFIQKNVQKKQLFNIYEEKCINVYIQRIIILLFKMYNNICVKKHKCIETVTELNIYVQENRNEHKINV